MNGKAKVSIKSLGVDEKSIQLISNLPVDDIKKCLRQIREIECFAVTDRPLWYNRLTEEQKAEINEWYEKWLKVTDTFEIPTKPKWIM